MITDIRVTEIEATKPGRCKVKLRVWGDGDIEQIMHLIEAAPQARNAALEEGVRECLILANKALAGCEHAEEQAFLKVANAIRALKEG